MSSSRLPAELIAEFLGTFVLLALGNGVVAMVVLFGTGAPGEIVNGGFTNITLGWGLAVMLGVFVAGKISGAHLNPAVTLALAIFRDFPWAKVIPYTIAQTLGAFCGAAIVFTNYREAFQKVDPLLEKTAGVFATFPAFPEAPMSGFMDQVVGTALLLFLILAITDEFNTPPAGNMMPLFIGLVVVAIGISFGSIHGYAINPARDFGPRLFTVLAGFRNNGLTDGTGVFWTPLIAPLVGGVLGAGLYDLGIRRFLREIRYTESSLHTLCGGPVMYLSVRELDIRKIPFKEELAPGVMEWDEGVEQQTPLFASGEASLDESTEEIRVAGHLKVDLQFSCDRCLKPIDMAIDNDFELVYQPPPESIPGQELEIHGEDIDVGFYDGEGIELNDVFREQILLMLPSRALCEVGCKGLCPSCGANLNSETCNCTKPILDDRWAGLRKLAGK